MTGLVIAMEAEAKPFISLMKNKRESEIAGKRCLRGEIYGCGVCLIVCGIGKVNAASAAQALITKYKNIERILNIGVTGAVNPALNICDVCAAEKAVQYDFDLTAIDDVPVGFIQNINTQYIYCDKKLYSGFMGIFSRSVTVATADRFSFKKEEAEFIKSLGGDVRDMECGAIAQVCVMNGIPFAAIKSISDTAEGDPSNDFKENLRRSTECFTGWAENIFGVLKNG